MSARPSRGRELILLLLMAGIVRSAGLGGVRTRAFVHHVAGGGRLIQGARDGVAEPARGPSSGRGRGRGVVLSGGAGGDDSQVKHTVVLMRHGQSDFNKYDIFTGWCDVDLNKLVSNSHAGYHLF
jgi:hypothetical protein